MKSLLPILAASLLAACASYGGSGLRPGEARLDDVMRAMGEPAMRWQDSDGSLQLAYPRGPSGFHTFMVRLGPDGTLQRIENVMDPHGFAQIRPGMTEARVLRMLGPPYPVWTAYFKPRDELVWEWRYCNDGGLAARFNVLFDGTSGAVRSAMSLTESQTGLCPRDQCWCSR